MSYGLRTWDASGNLLFDSTAAVGGVVIDVQSLASGASGTFTYPALAGRAVKTQMLVGNWQINAKPAAPDFGVSSDTSLGYPRVVCASRSFKRTVLVWADL